uniref:Uncharacterized protein n=1 Tax=Anguilla anguilla TaxID=7936 RepID=A0A0E9PNT7_ANGAN
MHLPGTIRQRNVTFTTLLKSFSGAFRNDYRPEPAVAG